MRHVLSTVALLGSLLLLPSVARADTIDDFVLTGEGHVITFSAPATTVGRGSYGAGGYDGGFYVDASNFIDNGAVAPNGSSLQVFPPRFYLGGGGFAFPDPSRNYVLVGDVLYSGSSDDATFLTGTFHLHDFSTPFGGTPNNPFTLTITPEISAVPEPSSLLLLATGIFAFAALTARNRVGSVGEPS